MTSSSKSIGTNSARPFNQAFFLPWHRWFILAFENLLRKVDCKVTVPYWDWSAEAQTLSSGRSSAASEGTGTL